MLPCFLFFDEGRSVVNRSDPSSCIPGHGLCSACALQAVNSWNHMLIPLERHILLRILFLLLFSHLSHILHRSTSCVLIMTKGDQYNVVATGAPAPEVVEPAEAPKPLGEVTLDLQCAPFFYKVSEVYRNFPDSAAGAAVPVGLASELESLCVGFSVADSSGRPGTGGTAARPPSPSKTGGTAAESEPGFLAEPTFFLPDPLRLKLKPVVSAHSSLSRVVVANLY